MKAFFHVFSHAFSLIALAAFSLPVLAQSPGQPSPEQMQQAMVQQAQVMSVMFDLRKSKLGFDETISAIKSSAEKRGWNVGAVQDMQAQMREAGAKDAKRMKVIHLCPAGANEKVAKAAGGKTPPLPCRATVFDGKDGKLYVVRMNLTNLAKTLPGDLAKAMAEVGAEEEALYKNILE
jgi:uncharacterized protein (DUF302 family)